MSDASADVESEDVLEPYGRPVIIHMHIPKTSGTTINKVLSDAIQGFRFGYGPPRAEEFRAMSQAERDSIDFLCGHFPYGLHRAFTRPVRYIACLREPQQRLLSFYQYVLEREKHPLHALVRSETSDFSSFLRLALNKPALRNRIDNLQVRIIAGRMKVKSGYEDVLETGLSNTKRGNFFIGDLERVNEFMSSLEPKLQLKFGPIPRLNASTKRLSFDDEIRDLASDAREILAAFTRWDSALRTAVCQSTPT